MIVTNHKLVYRVNIGLIVLFTFLIVSSAFAQRGAKFRGKFTKRKRYWSVGGAMNTLHYFGDIVPKNRIGSIDLKFTKPQIGLFLQRRVYSNVTVRFGLSWGQVAGDDHTSSKPNDLTHGGVYRYHRNLHFRNNIYDFSTVVIVDIFENRGLSYRRPKIPIPYGLLGVAAFYHNPQAIRPEGFTGSRWVNLRPLKTEGQAEPYSPIGISIPVGIGVRYKLTNNLDVAFEMGYRFTFTDYLDDVSGNYLDPGEFDNDLSRALHDRSAEPISLYSGEERNPQLVEYVSPVDGNTYTSVNGYGMPFNKRGSGDSDAYLVTGFQISYIFSTTRRAKFR